MIEFISGLSIGLILLFLRFLYEKSKDNKKGRGEFKKVLLDFYHCNLLNIYDIKLAALRNFLIANNKYLDDEDVNYFFNKWLKDPELFKPISAVGKWNQEKSDEVNNDFKIAFKKYLN